VFFEAAAKSFETEGALLIELEETDYHHAN
jgi:hypothetical protein